MNWLVPFLVLSLAVFSLGLSQLFLVRTVRLLRKRLDDKATITVEMWGAGGGGGGGGSVGGQGGKGGEGGRIVFGTDGRIIQ